MCSFVCTRGPGLSTSCCLILVKKHHWRRHQDFLRSSKSSTVMDVYLPLKTNLQINSNRKTGKTGEIGAHWKLPQSDRLVQACSDNLLCILCIKHSSFDTKLTKNLNWKTQILSQTDWSGVLSAKVKNGLEARSYCICFCVALQICQLPPHWSEKENHISCLCWDIWKQLA